MFKIKNQNIRELRNLQLSNIEKNADDYTVGLFNGLELALSVLEGREPEFKTIVSEQKVIERTEVQTGRTVMSGVKRRT